MNLATKVIKHLIFSILFLFVLAGGFVVCKNLNSPGMWGCSKRSPDQKYDLLITHHEKLLHLTSPFQAYEICIIDVDLDKVLWDILVPNFQNLNPLESHQDCEILHSMISWSDDSKSCRANFTDFSIEIRNIFDGQIDPNNPSSFFP